MSKSVPQLGYSSQPFCSPDEGSPCRLEDYRLRIHEFRPHTGLYLAVCICCKRAVTRKEAYNHLVENCTKRGGFTKRTANSLGWTEAGLVKLLQEVEIVESLKELRENIPGWSNELKLHPPTGFLEGGPAGAYCSYPKCVVSCSGSEAFRSHFRKEHAAPGAGVQWEYFHEGSHINYERPFTTTGNIAVHAYLKPTGLEDTPQMTDFNSFADAILVPAMSAAEKRNSEARESRADSNDMSEWIRATRWHQIFEQYDIPILFALRSVSFLKKDSEEFPGLIEAMSSYYTRTTQDEWQSVDRVSLEALNAHKR